MSKKLLCTLIATLFIFCLFAEGTNTSAGAPQVETLPFTETGDLSDNTNDNGERGRDEWWELTPSIDLTNVDIHPVYDGWDGYLYVYDSNLTLIAFDDDGPAGTGDSQLIMDITAGQTVFICVDEFSASTDARTFTLNISADQVGDVVDHDAPEQITNVFPAPGAANIELLPTMTWDFGANTETYDLYFDTANPPLNQVVTGGMAGATGSFTPSADLTLDTEYYWSIVCHNSTTTTVTNNRGSFHTTLGDDIIQVGNGTVTNQHLPIEPYFGYSYTQTIYLQSEIDVQGRRIERISYQYNQDNTLANCNEWVIYMAHSAETGFADTDSWLPISQFTEVYNGPLPTVDENGWIEFVLTTPFVYNNSDNLVIAVEENQTGFGESTEEFFCETVTGNRAIAYFNDQTDTDPNNPLTANSLMTSIPNTKLEFGDIPVGAQMMLNPETIDFGTNFVNTTTNPVSVSMQNTGTGTLTVSSVVLNDDVNFSLVDNNAYPLALNSTESASFDVLFNPTIDGPINSTITITDDITRQTYDIAISGTGFEATVSNFPYMQSFDTADYPIEWTVDPEDSWFIASTDFGGHGADFEATGNNGNFIGVDDSDPDTIPAHLYSPPFDLTGLSNPILTFYYWIGDNTNAASLNLDLIIDGNTTADVAVITDPDGATEWTHYELSLAAYVDQIVTIDFRAMEEASNFYGDICLDDIGVYDNSTPPSPTTLVSPTDAEIGVAMTGDLSWSPAQGADGYYVYLGTDNPPTDVYNEEDVTDALSLAYSGLQAGVVYYWQVVPYNVNGDAVNCPIWSFTTFNDLPLAATLVAPADAATAISETPTLSWADGGQFPDGYRLYLGTDNPPTDTINGDDMGNNTSYEVSTALQFETTYYWQVIPYNFVGDAVNCPVWSFTTNSNQNYGGDGNLYGGYYFANNTPSGIGLGSQPIFEWVDISTTGTAPIYSNTDDGFATVPIGFTFTYFGNDYTDISLGTNGYAMFTNPVGNTASDMTIPNTNTPNDVIAMLAMDLHTTDIPSNCYYGLDDMGNFVYTVEMWNDYNDTSEYIDVQLILYPTGRIKIQYRNHVNPNSDVDLQSIPGDACIGIENADGTIGHQYRLNGVGGPLNEGMALCYALNPGDLSDGGNGLFLPSDIEFDVVTVDSDSDVFELRMRNFTDTAIELANQPVLSGDNVDQFSITDNNTYPLSIAGGSEATIDIQFSPTSVGHKTAMLTIVDDYVETERNTYEITMHGYGYIADSNDTSDEADEFAIYIEDIEDYHAIIQPETDIDWYVFWQTAPAELNMHTEHINGSSVDLSAFLYGPYDDVDITVDELASIAFSDDDWTDGVNPHIVHDVPDGASGFYYLRIARSDNSPTPPTVRSAISGLEQEEKSLTSKNKKTEVIQEQTNTQTTPTTRWATGDYALWISTDNPVAPSGFDPPTALTHNITYQGIELSWLAPELETRQLEGYNVYRDDLVVNTEPVQALFYLDTDPIQDQTYEYKITALYSAPAGESVPCDSIEVTFEAVDPPIIAEDFETYDDFATEMQYWTLLDLDGEGTHGFNNGIDFPGEHSEMAFIVFNPSATVPVLQFADAYSGDKYAACFAADSGSNDDWLITPRIQLTDAVAYLDFKARSYTTQYGPELLEVGISMGGTDPSDFTIISGDTPLELPQNWDSYHYDLDAYSNELIRVGFRCTSSQTFFAMIDAIMIMNDGAALSEEEQVIIPETTALRGNYPNPFNPETTISFDVKENSTVTIDVYNIRGQRVNRIVEGDYNAGRHSIVWDGSDDSGSQVSSGVYFYRMQSGSYAKTKKMILMK